MKHVDGVKFDQINSASMEGVDNQWETTQFWRDIDCVMVETLMSGTQGEKAHIVCKEEDGSHMRLAYEYYFDMPV